MVSFEGCTSVCDCDSLSRYDFILPSISGFNLLRILPLHVFNPLLYRAVVLLPGYTVAMSNLGVVVQGLGFLREAEFWFEQAVATDLKPYYAKLDQEEQEGGTFRSNTNSNEDSDGDSSTLNRKQGAPISSAVFNLANLFRDQVREVHRGCK